MPAAIAVPCEILPSHSTLLLRMLKYFGTAGTFYTFLALKRQLLMHYEIDLIGFQFIARCTTYRTTVQ
jgi:hypothetical protein